MYNCCKIPIDILNSERSDKFLEEYPLSFTRASSPDLVIWENLGMERLKVLISKAVVAFVVFLIVLFCWSVVIYLSNKKHEFKLRSQPSVPGCLNDVSGTKMLLDQTYELQERQNYFTCYCANPSNWYQESDSTLVELSTLCQDFKKVKFEAKLLTVAIAGFVSTIASSSKTVLRKISAFERRTNFE